MKKYGFTLIEIVIVCIVIGIITTVAIRFNLALQENAQWRVALTTVKAIGTGIAATKLFDDDFAGLQGEGGQWNPNAGHETDAYWERIGIQNPNTNDSVFSYDFLGSSWISKYAGGDPYAGSPRILAAKKGKDNYMQFVTMNISSGEICVHRYGHCDYVD